MAKKWYDDAKRRTYIATYKGEKALNAEVSAAADRGWTVQDTAIKSGVISRLPWLFRPIWAKDTYIVTFSRTDPSEAP